MESIQNPTQEPVQVPTSQTKSNWFIIVFSILGIILLASTIIFYFQNQKLQKQINNQNVSPTVQPLSPTSKLSSSISIPPDETAGWKTYTNEVCKYAVKFPTDWKKTSDPFVGEESINFSPLSTEVISSSDKSINISATSLNKRPVNNLQDEIDGYNNFLWKNWTNKKIEKINFENANAIKVTGNSYDIPRVEILILTNKCYYEFKGVGDYIKTFNQILSTFKFAGEN